MNEIIHKLVRYTIWGNYIWLIINAASLYIIAMDICLTL